MRGDRRSGVPGGAAVSVLGHLGFTRSAGHFGLCPPRGPGPLRINPGSSWPSSAGWSGFPFGRVVWGCSWVRRGPPLMPHVTLRFTRSAGPDPISGFSGRLTPHDRDRLPGASHDGLGGSSRRNPRFSGFARRLEDYANWALELILPALALGCVSGFRSGLRFRAWPSPHPWGGLGRQARWAHPGASHVLAASSASAVRR